MNGASHATSAAAAPHHPNANTTTADKGRRNRLQKLAWIFKSFGSSKRVTTAGNNETNVTAVQNDAVTNSAGADAASRYRNHGPPWPFKIATSGSRIGTPGRMPVLRTIQTANGRATPLAVQARNARDRKSTRLNSSH